MTSRLGKLLPVALPLSLFVAHVFVFGMWIVDDAGIVFAVARNAARGFGLVCQVGGERVEAYSSLPWLAVIAASWSVGIFHFIWLPKILSVALIAAAFAWIYLALVGAAPWGKWVALVGLSGVSLQTGFVVWNVSGLENPLYVFSLGLLFCSGLKDIRTRHTGGCSGLVGVAAGVVAIARPEGTIFVVAYPLWRVLWTFYDWQLKGSQQFQGMMRYAIGVTGPVFGLIVFRWMYFGELLPNPYFAKGGPTSRMVLDLLTLQEPMVRKLLDLMKGVGGEWLGSWILVAVLGTTLWLWSRRLAHPIHGVLCVLLGCSTAGYLLLPGDWMGEYRYATSFFLFFYLYVSALLWPLIESLAIRQETRGLAFTLVASVCLLATAGLASQRSAAFAQHPALPIQEVIESGRHFERLAVILGVPSPSVLTPSVGGALLTSSVRIYDSGMLCDRTIAHSLGEGVVTPNRRRFYDYVFEELRPTLISTSAYHTWLADFDRDPRFRRDYIPIKEYIDQWVYERYGVNGYSGEFVRREVLSSKLEALSQVEEEVRNTRYFGCVECQRP